MLLILLTVVVKLTQLLRKLRGVEPVTSSHWALVVPPSQPTTSTTTTTNTSGNKDQIGIVYSFV